MAHAEAKRSLVTRSVEPPRQLLMISSIDYLQGSAPANRHIALANGLVSLGHSVAFLLPQRVSADALGLAFPQFQWFSLDSKSAIAARLGWRADLITSWRKSVGTVLADFMPDAIFCLDREPLVLGLARRLARAEDVPIVHEMTEFPDVVAPKGLSGKALLWSFFSWHLPNLDGCLVISTALSELVSQQGQERVQCRISPMYVDPSRFERGAPIEYRREIEDPLRLGYAGSLDPEKDGLNNLLLALSELRSRHEELPPVNLRVWGSDSHLEDMKALAVTLGIADSVDFVGRISASEIPQAFGEVDCLVLPRPVSRQATGGFPTKLGEYLASGRPVIATLTSDIGRYLENRVSAFLVPPNDVQELSDAVCLVAKDPALASEVGRAGSLVANERFNSVKAAREVSDFVEALIATRSRDHGEH